VSQELQEVQDLKDRQVILGHQETMDSRDNQALLVNRALQGTQGQREPTELRDFLGQLVKPAHLVQRVTEAALEALDLLVT